MHLIFDSLPYNARYSFIALILFLFLIIIWIKFGKEIRKEQKMKIAISLTIVIITSALYFWLIGTKVIENQWAIFIADFLFGLYVIAVFVIGVFLYLHKPQQIHEQAEKETKNKI